MILLRSLLYFSLLVLSIIFFTALLMICAPAPFKARHKLSVAWSQVNIWLLKIICGLDYSIEGLENIPSGNCIFLSKHQSSWETITFLALIPKTLVWVLKRELLWVPVFGWALAVNRPIAINRKAGRAAVNQVIEQGTERLNSGCSVMIFPEGTRVAPGVRKRYGIGGAILAEASGYPVVPIAHNAGIFWRRRDIRKYPGTINVVIGQPIATDGLSAQEINARAEEWIEATLAKMPSQR